MCLSSGAARAQPSRAGPGQGVPSQALTRLGGAGLRRGATRTRSQASTVAAHDGRAPGASASFPLARDLKGLSSIAEWRTAGGSLKMGRPPEEDPGSG